MEVLIPANFSHHFIFGGTKESCRVKKSLNIFVGFVVWFLGCGFFCFGLGFFV